MSNVRVRTKLLGGFAVVLALMVVVGALAIVKLGSVGNSVDAIANGSGQSALRASGFLTAA